MMVIVINRIKVCLHMCVNCIYLLCIYKDTHIQHIFWKYLHVYVYIFIFI